MTPSEIQALEDRIVERLNKKAEERFSGLGVIVTLVSVAIGAAVLVSRL